MAPTPLQARSGAFAHLHPGQKLKIINTHGTQVVDTWAFSPLSNDVSTGGLVQFKYLSMCHTRAALGRVSLSLNDTLRDNERKSMLMLVEDTSGGVHDLLFAACDKHRYTQLGVEGYHDSCADNLQAQLDEVSSLLNTTYSSRTENVRVAVESASRLVDGWTPDPLNLFMNVPVKAVENGKGGEVSLAAPSCPKGGFVVLRAEMECVVIMSACPMDLTAIYETRGAEFEILPA